MTATERLISQVVEYKMLHDNIYQALPVTVAAMDDPL